MKRILAFLLVLVLGVFLVWGNALALDLPSPTGYVNDQAGMFSSAFQQELETDLADFEKETNAEIAVVTVENLQGTTVEDFAVQLFEKWEIGKKDEDNGILILIAQEERKMRIEVGYGLEPLITDGRAGRITREQMTPAFKKDDYDQGVGLAVAQIQEYIRSGEPPVAEETVTNQEGDGKFPLVVFGFFILIYLSAFWGRSKRTWPGGVVGGLLGAVLGRLAGGLMTVIFAGLGFGIFGFILDKLLSRNYKKLKKAGKSTGFFTSRGGFFSGGGKSSGGGFGGFGGGSSGGGGASGGW